MSTSKKKGTAWETEIVKFLVDYGFRVRRKVLSGSEDKGDIEFIDLPFLVVEAKNGRKYELAEWVREAETEARNCGVPLGVVWMHQNRKASPGDGFVVCSGRTFLQILDALLFAREVFEPPDNESLLE